MTRYTKARPIPLLSGLALSAIVVAMAAPSAASAADDEIVSWPLVCSADGVCLAYATAALADHDEDGIADLDEKAVGTDAADPKSAPKVDELVTVLGKGLLPSFELAFSEIIIVPETFPDGTRIVPEAPGGGRASTLARLGIDESLIAGFGLSLSGGLVIDQVLGATGMTLDKSGRPVRTQDGAPVERRVGGVGIGEISQEKDGPDMGGQPAMGTDRNGGKDTSNFFVEGFKKMFGIDKEKEPAPKDPKPTDGGVPVSLTSGDEGNAVLPLTPADMERVVVKLNGTRTPVQHDPKVNPDPGSIDVNPHRTIMLVVDGEPTERFQSLLKIVLVEPSPTNPADRNTNFGPNGGLLPGVTPDSGWPKP